MGIDPAHASKSNPRDNETGVPRGTILSWTPVGPGNFAGQIAEFYCFNSALSSSDRQTLENFLKAKYGI